MGVSSSESHDLTAFYELLTASFGVLSQNTGFYPSLDRIVETTLGPLNLGPRGGAFNKPKSPPHGAGLGMIWEVSGGDQGGEGADQHNHTPSRPHIQEGPMSLFCPVGGSSRG